MADTDGLTMDEVRARVRAAGVTIAEARLDMVRRLVGEALAALRAVDAAVLRAAEPAVTFDAAAPYGPAGTRRE
jgi:hypothetical protein